MGAAVMAVLLVIYLVFAVNYAIQLIGTGVPIAVTMGVALLVLPLIGAGFIAAELVFGIRAERLARRLEAEDALPTEQLPTRSSGRVERDAADELFPVYQAAVEAAPEDWRAWFRLALAYDASGDRRRARWATRQAIRLERATPGSPRG
ncbi:hypothetical protein FLP23_07420 [Protaetiibacter larvae]|uniref:Tetratricopeptide repeat protein n=1 Tax=Protaetiibacter larvae TaxID=2592654 RepID=A0A5C1YAF3_9MICO|nr:hypothetical protein FLP23_07420 [Protaetiibacter larvae]